MANLDRIRGILVGVALGDALGWPTEARGQEQINQLLIYLGNPDTWCQYTASVRTRGGYRSAASGQVSDDTEMTIALTLALLQTTSRTYEPLQALLEYNRWMNCRQADLSQLNEQQIRDYYWRKRRYNNNFDKGKDQPDTNSVAKLADKFYDHPPAGRNTQAIFQSSKFLTDPVKIKEHFDKTYELNWPLHKREQAQSNGAVMRCAPLAILALISAGQDPELINDCRITNPSSLAMDIECAVIYILENALLGNTLDYLENILRQHVADKPLLKDIVDAALAVPPRAIRWSQVYPQLAPHLQDTNREYYPIQDMLGQPKTKGWVGSTFYIFVWTLAMLRVANPKDIYWTIISKPYSDTDTNAAVAGALIGAYYGYDKLLESNTLKAWWQHMQQTNTGTGSYLRPEMYHPKYLIQLADALYEKYRPLAPAGFIV